MANVEPALVLRTHPTGESDLVVVVLSARGKVALAARGARKSRRRFPGGLSPGLIGEASWAEGRGSLARLEGFAPQNDRSALGRDLEAFAYVAYVCELADVLTAERDPSDHLFSVSCAAVEAAAHAPHPSILRWFELHLLAATGHLGDPAAVFSRLGPGVIAGVEALLSARSPADTQTALSQMSVGDRRGLRDALLHMIRQSHPKPLRSLDFFAQIRGTAT